MNTRTLTEDEMTSLILGLDLLIDQHQSATFEADQTANDNYASRAARQEAAQTAQDEQNQILRLQPLYEALNTGSLTITPKTAV